MNLRRMFLILFVTVAGSLGTGRLSAQPAPPSTQAATSIEVKMVQAGDVTVPKEFQIALYENLVQEINRKSGFNAVYRDGARDAHGNPGLLRMRSTITGFKEGSERDRQVTTVKGATKIVVHCQFTDDHGTVLLEREVQGRVLFFGNNLKATQDFAKKAAKAANDALARYRVSSQYPGGA